MTDHVLESFLGRNCEEGLALARESDLLNVFPQRGDPPRRYVAEFRCRGLVCDAGGRVVEASQFLVGISFPDHYLRGPIDQLDVLTWIGPPNVHHCNISNRAPLICVGRLEPRTDLVSILYQIYALITWQKFAAHDGLNEGACQWARNQPRGRFPIDRRPLKTRVIDSDPRPALPEAS